MMWLVARRHLLISKTTGTFRRRPPRLKEAFGILVVTILTIVASGSKKNEKLHFTMAATPHNPYSWVSSIRVCFLEHAGRKDAHRAMNILYAEDIPDLGRLFTVGAANPVPEVITLLRSQLCDDLIVPAATQTVDAHLVVPPLMQRCTFRIGWNGGPRGGKVIRDATSFKAAIDLGHTAGKTDFELLVGISHLYFDSRADPLSFLDWTKIGTSQFPMGPIPRQMGPADIAAAVARAIPSATDIATAITGALIAGYSLLCEHPCAWHVLRSRHEYLIPTSKDYVESQPL
jgi:hypothetical protein